MKWSGIDSSFVVDDQSSCLLVDPSRAILFFPDSTKLADELHRELFLPQVGPRLDNARDERPVRQVPERGRRSDPSRFSFERFGKDGA